MHPPEPPGDPHGAQTGDEHQAAVFDFVVDYLDDLETGRVRQLAAYLSRFPGHETAVAEEYLRQEDLRREGERRKENGDGSQEGADEQAQAGEHQIGPYRLLRELGSGGQGSVWLAADTRIQRRVALKLLSGLFITEERRKRLRREAESVARLAHPGICTVLEAEVDGDQPYIAMHFVEGADLSASLDAAKKAREVGEHPDPVPWIPKDRKEQSRCLLFFERAARALHAAHEAGLIHRDIKPGNLIVTPQGEPMLLDFGLALDLERLDDLTRSGDILGTPHYMSPEQLRGQHRETDRRTDVYSLGVTLFECLTGQRPFDGATRFTLERSILLDPLPDPCGLNSELQRDVRVVLETATDRDPARRYATALDLAEDLRRIREFEPVRARPAGIGLRLARWSRRQPVLATALCVTLLSLTFGLWMALSLLAAERSALESAHGRQFTSRARDLTESDPDLALLLGLEGANRLKDRRGRSTLYGPLETCQLERVLDRPMGMRFWQLALTEPGQVVGAMNVARGKGLPPMGTLERWDLNSGERSVLWEAPGTAVRRIGVHPSGKALVLGTDDGRLVGLDLESGQTRFELHPGAGAVEGQRAVLWIEFAPSGREFAVQMAAGETLRYHYPSGEILSRRPCPPLSAALASYSPSGDRLLISGCAPDGPPLCRSSSAWVMDLRREMELAHLEHGTTFGSEVNWAGWSPSGDRIVTVGQDGLARMWDARPATCGEPLGEPLVHAGPVRCAAFSPDGRTLATGTDEGELSSLYLWDIDGGEPRRLRGHGAAVSDLGWSPSGALLASTARDLTVRVWNAHSGQAIKVGRTSMIPLEVLWTRDERRVLTSTLGYRAHLWNAGRMPYVYRLEGHAGAVRWASFLPDGTRAVTAGADGTVRLWSTPLGTAPGAWTDSGVELAHVELHSTGVSLARLGRSGRLLLTAGDDNSVRLFDLDAWAPVGAERRFEAGVRDFVVCSQPQRVAVLDAAGSLSWFDPASPGSLRAWEPSTEGAVWTHLALEPGSTRLAAVSDRGTIEFLDLATGNRGAALGWALEGDPDHALPAKDFHWHPAGGELAVLDGAERLWRLRPDEQQLSASVEFRHHRFLWMRRDRWVLGWDRELGARTAFHDLDSGTRLLPRLATGRLTVAHPGPGGTWLATADSEGLVQIWSVADGEVFSINDRHQGPVLWIAFSPIATEGRVITASEDGTAMVWPVDPVPAALARRPREFGVLERRQEWALAEGQ